MNGLFERLKEMNLWHFWWIAVVSSEILTYCLTTISSHLLWGGVSNELLIIGAIDSFFVSLIVAGFVIFFILKLKGMETENRQLHLDLTAIRKMEQEKEALIAELQEALQEVKKLSGLLPICSSCKNIRDDTGYWNQIETYLKEHTDAEFSHSICPDCSQKLYGTYAEPARESDGFSFEIDLENNLIHVYCSGFFTVDDICNGAEQLYGDPLFKKGMNSIVDLTRARIDLDFDKVRDLAKFIKSMENQRGECRIATLVNSDFIYGIVRMLGALSDSTTSKIRPFKGYDEAYKWILEVVEP